jgi:hypothetical protein
MPNSRSGLGIFGRSISITYCLNTILCCSLDPYFPVQTEADSNCTLPISGRSSWRLGTMQKQLQKLLKIAVAIAVEILLNVTGFDTLAGYGEFVFDPQRFDKSIGGCYMLPRGESVRYCHRNGCGRSSQWRASSSEPNSTERLLTGS